MKMPIATVKKTREIQDTYGVSAKKSFGQNFIIEPGVVDKIARSAIESEDDLVFEIGPGIGALTEYLTKYAKQVVAFEIDERLPEVLEKEIGLDRLHIEMGDILEKDLDTEITRWKQPGQKVRFVSNLPYYITTPILFKLFESKSQIDSITVMMQKEVADRFLASSTSKEYNALSVITQYRCNVKKVMDVSRSVFWPKPNVDSTVLQFTFKNEHPIQDEDLFFDFVKGCFVQRRKTIYNNLAVFLQDKARAAAILEHSGIPQQKRAQQLQLADFIRLFEENYEDIRKCKSESGTAGQRTE